MKQIIKVLKGFAYIKNFTDDYKFVDEIIVLVKEVKVLCKVLKNRLHSTGVKFESKTYSVSNPFLEGDDLYNSDYRRIGYVLKIYELILEEELIPERKGDWTNNALKPNTIYSAEIVRILKPCKYKAPSGYSSYGDAENRRSGVES